MKSRRIYLQGSNGETDIENGFVDTGRGEERVRYMERVTWKLTLPYVKCLFSPPNDSILWYLRNGF